MTRRQFWPILLLVLIHAAFLFPLITPGFYQSHDGENHLARFAAYYKSFSDGQIPPRWAGDLNYQYGSPVLNFFYPLPGYIASFLHLLGFSFQSAFKIIIGASFMAAPLSMYLWLRQKFKTEIAFTGALLYGLAPYHFLNMYVRGDIAEMLAISFVPLVLWAIEKRYVLSGGIFYGLLILSHNAISLMFSPVLLAYALSINNKERLHMFSLFILGLGLSAFFWIPALFESKYTLAKLFIGDMFTSHFPSLGHLIYSPWGFGADVNGPQGLSPQVGPLLWLLTIATILCMSRLNKQPRHRAVFWLVVFILGIFFSLSVSTLGWLYLPLLSKFQFPWRLTALTTFAAVGFSVYGLTIIQNRYILMGVILLSIALSIPMTKIIKQVDHPDNYYVRFPGTTYYHGEATTVWKGGDASVAPGAPWEVISGSAIVTQFTRMTGRHTFVMQSSNGATILDNTLYYPGWNAKVDSIDSPIQFQDPNHRGLITFFVPAGPHTVIVSFRETWLRSLSNTLSVISLFAIPLLWIFRKKARRLGLPV